MVKRINKIFANYIKISFLELVFFNYKNNNIFTVFRTILLLVVWFTLFGCGDNVCRTPEQTILGGEWESSQITKVKPINPNIIKQENQFGAYVLHDGTTESMAKENLWHELKTQSNNDIIVKSGNKLTMDVSDSVILSGTSQMLNVKLSDYIKLDGGLVNSSKVVETKRTIKQKHPYKITKIVKYKANGTCEYDYKYDVEDDNGTKVQLSLNQITNDIPPSCKPSGSEKINYIWYFPKKIVFHKWFDDNYDLIDKVVTVDVEHNQLSCKVKSAGGVLWYVCIFDYGDKKLQYKRRVTPIIIENYPQFEEQLSRTDEDILQLLSLKSKSKDSSSASKIDECYKEGSVPDKECAEKILDQQKQEQERSQQLTDEEYKQNYYMCIFGGKQDNNNGNICSEYKFGTIGTEDERTTTKSPIMVVFKTYNEIYGSGTSNLYDNHECFQQNEYKNRFLPYSSSVATVCKDRSKYQQFCRMAPKNIEYNLHKIRKSNYDWLDYDASDKQIDYCTKVCKKKSDYNLDDVVGECPKDCAVQLYTDNGTTRNNRIQNPSVVSCIDYQHRRRKQVDPRAGARYDDTDNTLYYLLDESLIDDGKIDAVKPNNMPWKQARIPCITASNASDEKGYRRIDVSSLFCCGDFTNTTKTENDDGVAGYFMCDDIKKGTDCKTSLITSTVCNSSMIAQGNCYHIITPNYTSDRWHGFCDGYDNDVQTMNDMTLVKAKIFDPAKPAYLASPDAIRKYIDGSIYIPKIYPDDSKENVGLEYGLMPVASDDIVSIECTDDIFPNLKIFEDTVVYSSKPNGYDEMSEEVKQQFNIVPDSCVIDGTYSTYNSDNKLLFGKDNAGIIPMQWFSFPVKAGDSIPITIATQYPILVKSGDQYIEMKNGNGLMVYLDPDDDNDTSGSCYSDPEMWQCNVGIGGSYAYYRPYEYSKYAVYSKNRNPRKIATPNELWWYCDDERPMWFSGYDFKNIKTGKPVYMHTYKVDDVLSFLPKYQSDDKPVPPEELPVEKVGCNEDGLPSSMVINGQTYDHSSITGLLYDESYGARYVYSDGTTQRTISIEDSSITNKTYERYAPKIIVVDLVEEGLTNVQIQANTEDKEYNNLVRTYKKDGNNILQAYYEFDYFSKHYKIRIEDNIIHKPAVCYNEGEYRKEDSLSDDTIQEMSNIKFVNNSKYYVLNKSENSSEIFTRFGPFSGMHSNTSGLLLPAIYTTEGACLEHFIYDEQHKDSPEGNTEMSTWLWVESTHILRKNLSKPWRLEFTTPAMEYNDGKYLIDEKQDNSTGTLSRCYNKVDFEDCGPTDIPDIVIVDLSKTNNAKKKDISGNVVLYKDENFVKYITKQYYPITFAPLGWNNYQLDIKDPMISSIKCNNYSNCAVDEIPVIELTQNGVSYRIENGDIAGGAVVKIGKLQKKDIMSFDLITSGVNYDAGNYTIDDPVLDKNAICFTGNKVCKTYLDKYIGVDTITEESEMCDEAINSSHEVAGNGMVIAKKTKSKRCKVKNEYLYSLSKLPYIVSCQNSKVLDTDDKTEMTSVYSTPYQNAKIYPELSSNEVGGFVLKTNIHSFVSNQYFARCVPSWITPKWMVMEQPNDPSTFYTGHTAVSGSYIAPDGANWTTDYVKDKYHLNSVWRSYGGVVRNAVMNQKCSTKTLPNGTKYKASCELNDVQAFDASFVARYPKQLIMVKPMVNDPINTSDDDCEISVNGTKQASTKIKMNSPFGFQSAIINNYALDRKESKKNISGVQPKETINGDGKHGDEFFKQSEFQRNMIGAGILTPVWNTLSLPNGTSAVFDQGDKINFNAIGDYYASGALSHKAQAYCMVRATWSEVGAISMYALALDQEVAAGVLLSYALSETTAALFAVFPANVALFAKAAALYLWFLAKQASTIGFMVAGTEMAQAPNGKMVTEKAPSAKRSCGVATAFKVVPLPPSACLQGYITKCSNNRINDYVSGATSEKALLYCKSEENVNFRTERMKIGACNKHIKDIDNKNSIGIKPQRYKSSDAKYPNMLIDAVGGWSDLENIYEENCGVCVKKKSIYSYNGITYSLDELLNTLPKTVRTSEHCKNYIDDDGNAYTWTQNIKVLKPFDSYKYSNKKIVFDSISDILSRKISECDKDSHYIMSFDDEAILNNVKTAFLKMQIRNLEGCVSNMMQVYYNGLNLSGTTDECKNRVSDDIEVMSNAACNDMLNMSKNIDGNEYYNYTFSQNAVSAVCQDDKYVRKTSEKNNNFASVTRVDAEDILSQYGYGELTTDTSYVEDGTTNIILNIPTTIRGKEFKTAKLGFFLAGDYDDNPLYLYKNYRIINQDDLQRGYTLNIGNGSQVSKGKYLYYYIQPLNDQGIPDPSYNPNKLFSPSSSDYTPETISSSNLVYSFKAYDKNDSGKISIISPRTGKLWVAILDSDKLSPGDKDADGRYIEFIDANEDGTARVNGNNVLYTHGGYYNVHVNVQTDSEDSIDDIVSSEQASGVNKLLTTLIIKPIKTLFIGDYICKRCLLNNPSKCEIKPSDAEERDWYTSEYKKVCDYEWEAGMLGKIASSFLKIHLLYVAWFIFVVFSVFIIGFQFITGEQKFDFKFMKDYLWRYALIMAFVNPNSLGLYIDLFVKPAFNLAEGLSAFVAGNFSSEKYTAANPQDFIYSAFGPIDKILKFWINRYTFEKLLAILFSSWSGFIVIIILLMCFVFFMISVIEAVVLYVIILIKMSLYFAIGPAVFLLLIHEKTADKFTDWWKTIAACIAEQVMMFAGLSFFSTIYYYIIKGSMNFVYCWEPILKIPILDITLFSMWRISGTMPVHMAELSGFVGEDSAINTKGFNFLTAFILFIITCMMSEFINKTSTFGAKIFGKESSMPSVLKETLGQVKSIVKGLPMQGVKSLKDTATGKISENKNDSERRQ